MAKKKKTLRKRKLSNQVFLKKANRRTELLYAKLQGDKLTKTEKKELAALNKWFRKNLPGPARLPKDIRKLVDDVLSGKVPKRRRSRRKKK